MSTTFGVEVEHVRYALLLDTEKGNRGQIDLTTLADNQKTAHVKIFLFENHEKTLIHTIKLHPLPPQPAGDLRIICSARFTSNRYLEVGVRVGQKTVHTGKVDVKKYRKRSRWWIIPVALLLLGGIASAFIIASGRPSASNEELDGKTAAGAASARAGAGGSGTPDTPAVEKSAEEAPAEEKTETAGSADVSGSGAGTDRADTEGTAESPRAEITESAAAGQESPKTEQAEPEPVISLSREQLYFLPESSVLLEQAKGKLQAIRRRVESENVRITAIEGHCALYGSEESREWLSEERAEAAYLYLRQIGTEFPEPPLVRGYGGQEPVTRDQQRQELNRRVEITIETTSYREE